MNPDSHKDEHFLLRVFCRTMASSLPIILLVLSVSMAKAQLRVFNLRASNLPSTILGTTDGYVKVFCSSGSLGKTSVRNNDKNPWWAEEFTYFNAQESDELMLEVWDSDFLFDDLLGTHAHDCFLDKGGVLHYSYTLGDVSQ